MFFCNSDLSPAPYKYTRSLGRYAPLLLAPVEGLGALRVLLGAFGPLLSCSIQKYTLRRLFGHLILQNPLRISYLTLYDSPNRPIGKTERGPKAPSVASIQVSGCEGSLNIKVIVTGPVTVSNLKITVQWFSNGYTVIVTSTK